MVSLIHGFIHHKETIYNFLWRVVQILGKQGTTFFIFLVCARQLSPYDFGIYNYVFSTIFLLIIFSDFGISIATSKFTAEYSASDSEKLKLLLFNSAMLIIVLSGLIALPLFFFWDVFYQYRYILYCIPLLFLVPLTSLLDGFFRGLKQFRSVSLVYLISAGISLPLFYVLISEFGLHGAFISQNVYYLLLVILLALHSRRKKIPFRAKLNIPIVRKVVGYSIVIGLADIGLFLYTRADILILGHYNLIEEIGYYEIINRMFLLIIMPAQILATVVAPNVTRNFTLKKYDSLQKNIRRDVLLLLVVGSAVAISCFLLFPYLFKYVFGGYDMDTLVYLMNIIIIIVPIRYFSTFLSIGYITPSGNAKISTVCLLFFGVVNILLDFIFVEPFGVVGIIYATLISQLLFIACKDTLFYFFVFKRKLI